MDVRTYFSELGRNARIASRHAAKASTAQKNNALLAIARLIDNHRTKLQEANQFDLVSARSNGKDAAFIDRLTLNDKAIQSMIDGLKQMAQLPDPVGEIGPLKLLPSGIQVGHMRVPLGVIGIIYESRPNVTIDAAGLCLKAGNAAILRGGSEAIQSNTALAALIHQGLAEVGLNQHLVQVVSTPDRAAVSEMITHPEYVDVIIPRGGKSLIERITAESKVPVIKHLDGICHVYVDDEADLEMATNIAFNAKTQRYGTCNTMECLLVHSAIAPELFARLLPMYATKPIELRCDPASLALVNKLGFPAIEATEEDFRTEYLGPILSVKLVDGVDAAMAHINEYSSQHTDAIVTRRHDRAMQFLREVDSASVMVNASTRFADGFEYGLGAEIGISTNKLHARGPVGLEGITTYKWVVLGHGEVRT